MQDSTAALTRAEVLAATGKGVRVLVIDSGVEVNHPQFNGRSIPAWVVDGPDAGLQITVDSAGDVFGHGTAVAGILSQHAPDASIESLRALGGDLRCTSDQIIAGLRWGIDKKYDIINCSFGTCNSQFLGAYKDITDFAFCQGVLMVTACNNYNYLKNEYPGAFPTSIATDFGQMEAMDLRRRLGRLVEFISCGEWVQVPWKDAGTRTVSGSSFAAPHLAAMVARIHELRPTWNACQVKSFLYEVAAPAEN